MYMDYILMYTTTYTYIYVYIAVHSHPACPLHAVYLHIGYSPCLRSTEPLPSILLRPGPWVSMPSANTSGNPLNTLQALRGATLPPLDICSLQQCLGNHTTGLSERLEESDRGFRDVQMLGCCKPGSLHLHAYALVGPTPLLMGCSHSLVPTDCHVLGLILGPVSAALPLMSSQATSCSCYLVYQREHQIKECHSPCSHQMPFRK